MGEKWDNAKPAEKMLSLFTMLLFSHRQFSLSELSRELDCSKQTVSRLLDQLEDAGYGKLLRIKKSKEAFYQLNRQNHLPQMTLNAEGLQQLALCRDFIQHLLPESMRKSIDTTLGQASAFLPDGGELSGSIGYSFTKGRIDYTPFQHIMETLIKGIQEQRICTLRYKSNLQAKPREYTYAPKRLIALHEAMYISGWMIIGKGKEARPVHGNPTILALHRVQKAALTFYSSKDFEEPADEGKEIFGMMAAAPFTAQIRFDPSTATYVAEREWSKGQKVALCADGGITLKLVAHNAPEFFSWILSFGEKAEVLSPKWLRDAVAEKARALAKVYT